MLVDFRAAFPSVEQEFVDKDGANEAVYKGLVARQKTGPFSPATGITVFLSIVAQCMYTFVLF